MRLQTPRARAIVLHAIIGLAAAVTGVESRTAERARVQHADLPPAVQQYLATAGITRENFPKYVQDIEMETATRVAEGDREHLIHYALQSMRFTNRPRIEPAASARRFVESLPTADRDRLLAEASYVPPAGWPLAERARVADLLSALEKHPQEPRLLHFKEIVQSTRAALQPDALYPDYVRVARFLYKKEFVSAGDAGATAMLYHTRAHSSDTAIDAGFGVYVGLSVLHALDPSLRVKRTLIVGPGLDLAPRMDLIDAAEPQSYQPFAVADALLALSLSSETDMRVHSVDVNPRVVHAVEHAARQGATLHLFSGITETPQQKFSDDYRAYLRGLGRAIGERAEPGPAMAADRRYQHSIAVRAPVARALSAERLNVITERLAGEPRFDLVVATNVLAYFDDRELALALANIAAMLRPGGYFLHNEARPGLGERASVAGVPAVHMRSAVLGGPAARPLYDVIHLHQKTN